MKKLLLTSFLLITVNIWGAESTPPLAQHTHDVLSDAQIADAHRGATDYAADVNIVRFTFTLYKDQKKHDPKVWQEAVGMLSEYLTRLMVIDERVARGRHDSNYVEEVTFAFKKLLAELIELKKNEKEDSGVNGEFNVTFGDGKKPTKGCCGGNCRCAERYAGNCPCVNSGEEHQVVVVDVNDMSARSESEESDSDNHAAVIS